MKKFTSTITMILLAMMAFTFTSCEDEEIAYDLAGANGKVWRGVISQYYYDRWGQTGNHFRTTMEFYCDANHWTSGWGREVDEDLNDPLHNYWFSEFDWKVRNGVIELRYADTGYEPVYIREYTLNPNYFTGYMDDGTNTEIYFRLDCIRDFKEDYWNNYYNNYYYAPSRNMSPAAKDASSQRVRFASKGTFAKKPAAESK
jgi:hypothetical protein